MSVEAGRYKNIAFEYFEDEGEEKTIHLVILATQAYGADKQCGKRSHSAHKMISVIAIWISVMIICLTTQIAERHGTAM